MTNNSPAYRWTRDFGFAVLLIEPGDCIRQYTQSNLAEPWPDLPTDKIAGAWFDYPQLIAALRTAQSSRPTNSVMVRFNRYMTWTFSFSPLTLGEEQLVVCFARPIGRRIRQTMDEPLARIGGGSRRDERLDSLKRNAVEMMANALDADAVAIFSAAADGHRLRLDAVWPPTLSSQEVEHSAEIEALDLAQAVNFPTLSYARPVLIAGLPDRIQSASCVPLIADSEVAGIIAAYSGQEWLLADEETAFLGIVAQMIGDRIAKERATSAQTRLTKILDTTTDLVMLAEPNGRRIYMNPAVKQLLGISSDADIEGTRLGENRPAWARKHFQNVALATAIEEGTWVGESALLAADGREIPVSQVIIAHRGSDGSIEYISSISRDISDIKSHEAQLQEAADSDPLTGLANRRRFVEAIEEAIQEDGPQALFFIDLDDFKAINDSLGHAAGDRFLRAFADTLANTFNDRAVVARPGGDEFALLLPLSESETSEAAEKLLQTIRTLRVQIDGVAVSTTASIGVAQESHAENADELLLHADVAMYEAKDAGGNGWVLYQPGLGGRQPRATPLQWRQRIPEALAAGNFVLHAQPIVRLATNEVCGYELLLRLKDRRGRITHPATFLQAAEASGLIQNIDRWVAREALRIAATIQDTHPDIELSVNMSARAFGDRTLLAEIATESKRLHVNTEMLWFEVTETAAVANVVQAQSFLADLSSLGFRIALDDFGGGSSSFAQLRNLSVDRIKIDGAFIQSLPESLTDQQFVKAIARVANDLGIQTVAEFVSDAETTAILTKLGVTMGQGYYLGRPRPFDSVVRPQQLAA